MGLGAAPTYLVGLLGPELRDSLGLSGAQLGLLVGLFYGSTGLASLVTSRLIDPLGARRCIVTDQVVVAGALVLAVVWNTYAALALASALAGAAYALANAGTSVAVTAVSRASRPGRRRPEDRRHPARRDGDGAGRATRRGPHRLAGREPGDGRPVRGERRAGVLLLPRPSPTGTPHRVERQPLPARFFWIPLTGFLFVLGSQPLFSWLVLTLVDAGVSTRGAGLVSATGTGVGAVAMVLAARRSDRSGPARRALVGAAIAATSLAGACVLWLGSHVSLLLVVLGAVVAMLGEPDRRRFRARGDRRPGAPGRRPGDLDHVDRLLPGRPGLTVGLRLLRRPHRRLRRVVDGDRSWRCSAARSASWSSSAGCGHRELSPVRAPRPSRPRRPGACGRASAA